MFADRIVDMNGTEYEAGWAMAHVWMAGKSRAVVAGELARAQSKDGDFWMGYGDCLAEAVIAAAEVA